MKKYTEVINIRLTDDEVVLLKEKSQKMGINNSEYIRRCILERPIDSVDGSKVLNELKYEVNRIGNNINQIAKQMNSNIYYAGDVNVLLKYMQNINQEFRKVRMDYFRKKGE